MRDLRDAFWDKRIMQGWREKVYGWYLDLTPNQMFSLYDYPISGKTGLPLCKEHGEQLEKKEVVIFDPLASKLSPTDQCWVCGN